ncbi:hypothetical protein M0812_18716 [Anaeramoeba flamelloides]|uniref:Rap-GAP domain-containing protein n=1 Tax=Anaeramoeba flamelloides TaxID=1746091 RepID=A0AAV7Z685_9EUKA|nr:hypothetical protein M0812_18716 [Anaeramoeba flamelloides]
MFLPHIEVVTPLRQNKDSGVLIKFPPAIKQTIIKSVLQILLDKKSPQDLLGSPFAIKWAMECTGQSFALSLDNHETISQGIQLYKRWLSGKSLPPQFGSQKQKYYRDIFGHFSLLFQLRKGINNNLAQTHVKLCLQVIEIFQKIGSKDEGYLDEESWEHLLFVVIGVCDNLLSQEASRIEPTLTQELTPHLLKVVFDLWLQSGTQKHKMWERFENAFIKWRHQLQTIIQWSATTFGLMSRVINVLYGKHEGTEDILILLPPTSKAKFLPSKIKLTDEKLIFFWQKTLDLLGDPNQIQNPEIFFQAMSGIRDLVTLFLKIGTRKKYDIKYEQEYLPDQPDGNSILHIFGKSLFTAVQLARPGFEEGTECCYSILCNIFMTSQTKPFLESYITRFYESLIRAFENEKTSGRSICAILCNTTKIFSTDLPGIHILVPFYLDIIERIVVKKTLPPNYSVRVENLRKSCIEIILTLVCLPRYLTDLAIQSVRTSLKLENLKIKTFEDFKPFLMQILLKGFSNENDARNACFLLYSMGIYLLETINDLPGISSLVILTCQNFLCNPKSTQLKWPISVSLTALHLLNLIADKTEIINTQSNVTIPNLISSLSKLINNYINEPSILPQEDMETLVCTIFTVIDSYIMQSQWIYSHPKVLIQIMKSIELSIRDPVVGKTKKKQTKTFQSIKIKDAAMYLFHRLFKEVGNFPIATGPSTKSTTINETTIRDAFGLNEDEFNQLSTFLMIKRSRLMTIFEEPEISKKSENEKEEEEEEQRIIEKEEEEEETNDEKKLIILIRDINGKYAWRVRFRSLPLSKKLIPQSQWEKHIWNGEPRPPVYKQEMLLSQEQAHEQEIEFGLDGTILDYFSVDRELQHNCLTHVMGIQHRLEEVYRFIEEETALTETKLQRTKQIKRDYSWITEKRNIKKNNMNDDDDEDDDDLEKNQNEIEMEKNLINKNKGKSDKKNAMLYTFNNSRLFLANLGLIKLDGEDYVDIIEPNRNFRKSLGLLDKFPERITHTCSVFYIGPGQNRLTNPKAIYQNQQGSKDFQTFLTELGWIVDLQTHEGFKGGLDPELTGKYTPYYSNYSLELIFHVSTMIKFKEDPIDNKKNFLSKNRVVVVWVDDKRLFDPKLIKLGKNTLFIIIKPHHTGLFYITIENYLTSVIYGPLLSNTLLSRRLLAELVRKTIILNEHQLAISERSLVEPLRYRMGNLKAINNRFKINLDTTRFYTKLFSKK